MGRLRPGERYIYERVDDVIYARPFGHPPNDRFEIGRSHSARAEEARQDQLWKNIRLEAQHNKALQDTLDRAIMIYELSKKSHGQT